MLYRLLILLTIVTFALGCAAQRNPYDGVHTSFGFSATLTGAVHDASGQPVNGAHVDVIDPGTGRTLISGYTLPNGNFEITGLRQGVYEVVARSGISESRLQVDLDTDRDLNFHLNTSNTTLSGEGQSVSVSQMKVPGRARRMLDKAFEAFHQSKIDEAFTFVQKALTEYPDYAKALTLRGILNMQKGDNRDAEPDLERAVQLDYADDTGFVALASLYNNEGEYDRAQQTLDHGMTVNPKSWQANMEMARADMGKKDFGAAIRSLDRAQSFAPPEATVLHLFRAQAFMGLQDRGGAVKELQAYLEKSPTGANSDQARKTLAQLSASEVAASK